MQIVSSILLMDISTRCLRNEIDYRVEILLPLQRGVSMKSNTTIPMLLSLFFCFLVLFSTDAIAVNNDLIVSLSHYDPVPLNPGNEFDVWLQVENIGTDAAEEVEFELLSSLPFYLAPSEESAKPKRTISARGMSLLPYTLRVESDAEEGEYFLYYRYRTKGSSRWVPGQVKLPVKTQDANLVIENVHVEDERFVPGEVNPVSVEIRNAADSPLRNIRVSLYLEEQTSEEAVEFPFTPLGGTNEKVLYNLGAGESHSFSYNLLVDPDASAGPYKVPVQLQYQDDMGNNYTKQLITGFLVDASPDLLTLVDEVRASGNRYDITLRFINKGLIDFKFFESMVEKSDDTPITNVVSGGHEYVGDIDSDDYETVTVSVDVATDADTFMLPVDVTYYTANNNKMQESLELAIDTKSAITSPKGGNGIWILLIVGAVIGFFFYRRHKKQKRKQELDRRATRKK